MAIVTVPQSGHAGLRACGRYRWLSVPGVVWTQRERETLPGPLLRTLIRMLEAKRSHSVLWTEIRAFTLLKPSCEHHATNKLHVVRVPSTCLLVTFRYHGYIHASCINKRETQILISDLLFRCERRNVMLMLFRFGTAYPESKLCLRMSKLQHGSVLKALGLNGSSLNMCLCVPIGLVLRWLFGNISTAEQSPQL
jgi:hypothetical protein